MDEAQDAKTELEEVQRRDRRLRKAWQETGSVESVKQEKLKYGNLVKVDKGDKEKEEEKEKEEQPKEILIEKINEEEVDTDDIPEEEKLEE